MEILHSFGVNWILLAAQIVNFLIIFWLLKRFAYKPILAMLEKRRKMVVETVTNSQKAEEALAKAEEKEKEILKKAQVASQEVLADSQKQAQEILTTAEEQTKDRVAKMLEDAKKEIEEQTVEAQHQLSKHTALLAVELLKKSLSGMVDKKAEKEIVGKVTKKLKA